MAIETLSTVGPSGPTDADLLALEEELDPGSSQRVANEVEQLLQPPEEKVDPAQQAVDLAAAGEGGEPAPAPADGEPVAAPAPAAPAAAPVAPAPTEGEPSNRIPLPEYLREREARQEAQRNAEAYARRNAELEARLNPQQQPTQIDPYADPEGFARHQAAQLLQTDVGRQAVHAAVGPAIEQLGAALVMVHKDMADAKYGPEKVKAAIDSFNAIWDGQPQFRQAEHHAIMRSPNRIEAAIAWHNRQEALKAIGNDDPDTYFNRVLAERVKDPAFVAHLFGLEATDATALARATEAARAALAGQAGAAAPVSPAAPAPAPRAAPRVPPIIPSLARSGSAAGSQPIAGQRVPDDEDFYNDAVSGRKPK